MTPLRLAFAFFCLLQFNEAFIVKPVLLNEAPYDIWAHYHWVWLANEDETQESLINVVNDYMAYDIPVGAVNIDSSWPTAYQSFIWNENKFPSPSQMIEHFHSLDVKVLCWITSTVNNNSVNFNEGKQKGYFLNDGEVFKWSDGDAALLDYSFPEAIEWWHRQMDWILDLGIDGWKVDGTDPYIFKLKIARGHNGRVVTYREYADAYYRDFFYYTRQQRGPSALIMARPVDSFEKELYWSFAPNDVMFSGWVGDQKGNWDGLVVALNDVLRSAWRGYLNFGCDIGGYQPDDSKLGRSKEVFTRWFQLGAFLPLMENGGKREHRPWAFGNDTVDTYRVFANIHMNLAPFLLNAGTACFAKNVSVIRPLAGKIFIDQPSTFDYLLHEMIYVSPFTDNSTTKSLVFPGSSSTKWTYWFNNTLKFKGGDRIQAFSCPYNEFPAFVIGGSILPLQVDNHYTGLGTRASKGYVTLLINHPQEGVHKRNVHEFKSNGYTVEYRYESQAKQLDVLISAHKTNRFIVLVSGIDASHAVTQIARSSDSFEGLENHEDEDEFWKSNESGTLFTTSSQFFIRISESADKGVFLIIKNISLN